MSGDLGRVDRRGRLMLTGRLKLLIEVGGLKVNPMEVETALSEHAAVRDVVVVPLPVSSTVQRVKAIVTLRSEPDKAEAKGVIAELKRHARQRLSAWKVPRVIEVRESLPKTPTGKILRQAVQS